MEQVFVRNGDGQYYFVKEPNPKRKYYREWGPPAERIEHDENPLHAANRALKDEAGFAHQ